MPSGEVDMLRYGTGFLRAGRLGALCLLASGLGFPAQAATYFVSPTGDNGNPGSRELPFATWARGQTAAQAGDTVFFRGGTYLHKSTAESGVVLDKSGAPGRRIHYFAYPGETPVFNFQGLIGGRQRVKGVLMRASWIHFKGLEMMGILQDPAMRAKENWCIWVGGGSNNFFELLNLHHNMGPGLFIAEGANNLVLNCDSHDNYDLYSYAGTQHTPGENADGFGFHGHDPAGTGTVFRGCRAWWNADDGYDFIGSATPVTIEDSWAWNNGYQPGTFRSAGNGIGFKVGGYGMPLNQPPVRLPQHLVRFCLAFNNKSSGFYQNHHPIANFYYNNTSFNNGANFNMLGYDMATRTDKSMGILRNNIAYKKTLLASASGPGFDAANNSWNLPVTLTDADFQSVDTAGMGRPRRPDGSLPDLPFMKLNAGSDLIDKGIKVGLPYAGLSPDLGAFEYGGGVLGISHPNPRTNGVASMLEFSGAGGYDLTGRAVGPRTPAFRLGRIYLE